MADYQAIQAALDDLGGTCSSLAFQYRDDGSKFYICSIRLLSGSLAHGSGNTLEAAVSEAHTRAPIPRSAA